VDGRWQIAGLLCLRRRQFARAIKEASGACPGTAFLCWTPAADWAHCDWLWLALSPLLFGGNVQRVICVRKRLLLSSSVKFDVFMAVFANTYELV
jgi:hypothetical protein